MMAPLIAEIYSPTQDWQVFAVTAFLGLFAGISLMLTNRMEKYTLSVRNAYLLTTSLWFVIPLFGAIPFIFTSVPKYSLDFTNAVFESVSGMSTTGSTVYLNLDHAPNGVLIWRSMLCWLGGMGIVVVTMAILPYMRVGGMQLFQTESSDRSDKILPKVHQIAVITLIVYNVLVILCTLGLYMSGITFFDAINNAMPLIATAGFSTHDASFGYFPNASTHWVGTIFMAMAATPMMLYYSFFFGGGSNVKIMLSQAKAYWFGLISVIAIVTAYAYYQLNKPFEEALRQSAFNITSISATAGFASTDYNQWGSFIIIIFYFLTSMGGCTGSTSGGIKTFRIQVMAKMIILNLKRLISPRGVFSASLAGKTLDDAVMKSVGMFFILYLFVFCFVSLGVASSGADMMTSLSGAATALAGVGPGLGDVIGPAGTFQPLADSAKWFLIFGMLAGRLEIITILALFTRSFWRDFR